MSTRKLPDLPRNVLRDAGTQDRLDRVWRRLEVDLPTGPQRQRAALWWAPAAVVIIFGAGVYVGSQREQKVPVTTTYGPEPASNYEPASAPEGPRAVVSPSGPEKEERSTSKRRRHPLRAPIAVPVKEPAKGAGAPDLQESSQSAAPPAPEWQRLAEMGSYEAAGKELEASGGFAVALERASAEQLMLLHDLARIRGQRATALQALRRVVEQHRDDPNAEYAAYTLGTMLEKDGDSAGAARAFALYRKLAPKGDLAEDALVRQVEVALEQGDLASARQLADQYAKDFPNGDGLDKYLPSIRAAGDGGAAAVGDAGTPFSETSREIPKGGAG